MNNDVKGPTTLKENPMNKMTGVSIVILVSLLIINIFLMIVGKSVPFTNLFNIFFTVLASWIFYCAIVVDNNGVKEKAFCLPYNINSNEISLAQSKNKLINVCSSFGGEDYECCKKQTELGESYFNNEL